MSTAGNETRHTREVPVHEHDGDNRTRLPGERVTFAEAVELAWERLSSRELAPWTDS